MPPKQKGAAPAGAGGSSKAASRGGGKAGGASSGGGGGDFFKSEDILQAVLLADTFQSKFKPLTQQKPKVLLPLLNIPLLEYSIEFLVSGGVGELFLFCSSHAAQLQAYMDDPLAGGRWRRRKGLSIRLIVSTSCFSFGDALRHLDTLDVIKSDFVLLSGDVVSNLRLEAVVAAHKARVQQDKNNVMTIIFKQAPHTHRTRPLADDAVLVVDPSTGQLLHYDNDRRSSRVKLDPALLADAKQPLQYRYDLMHSHISVCTPEVLLLFTDNFDWQTLMRDFVPGVLGSDILGHRLFVHEAGRDEYAARAEDLRAYASISLDVLHRWTYPLVPDTNLLASTTYRYIRGNRYREDGVQVSRDAKVGEETIIGAGSSIGARSDVRSSVIGRDVTIGAGVRLVGSHVWSGAHIADGAVVEHAVLADGVRVGAGARVGRGAILSYGVVIGAGHVVPPYTRITTAAGDDDEEDDNERASSSDASDVEEREDGGADVAKHAAAASAALGGVRSPSAGGWLESEVGVGGVGRIYRGGNADDSDDDEDAADNDSAAASLNPSAPELNSIAPNGALVSRWLRRHEAPEAESEDEWSEPEEADDGDGGSDAGGEDDPSLANQLGAASSGSNQQFRKFCLESAETLRRGHSERLSLDDIWLEMSALKMSHNTSVEEFAHAFFLALFTLVHEAALAAGAPLDPLRSKPAAQALGTLLKQWWKLLHKFARLQSDQVAMLQGLEQACLASGFVNTAPASSPAHAVSAPPADVHQLGASGSSAMASVFTPLFTPTLQLLYNNFPLFSEESILQWADEVREAEGEGHVLYEQSAKFRQWLEEADEEDEDDEEDEEDA